MKRIAFARICQETNALSPVPTELAAFADAHLLDGDVLLAAAAAGNEVPGMFKRAELAGFMQAVRERKADIEPVPTISAWAMSGGPLTRACFDELEERLLAQLRAAGPVDGMYFALHGAMGVVGIADPEAHLLRSVRRVIGNVPLVASHDLHGNMTRERMNVADAIVAYQTNPHRDHCAIGKKAGAIAIGAVLGEIHPTMAWRTLPLLLGGGKTIDFLAPMRAVFKRMKRAERTREALAASTFMVHPWIAHPHVGWSTVAVTNNDVAGAERLAEELAEMCWERRHEQPPTFPPPAEAIAAARSARVRRKLGVVMMADTSDVVTAGSPGDSTHLLRALLADGQGLLTYAAVRDPAAVETLWSRSTGDEVTLPIGGTLDPLRSDPLLVTGRVVSKHVRHGFGKNVVIAVDHLRIVITAGPCMVMRPSFYAEVGLPIRKADVVVVKNFFPFLMFFVAYNRKSIFVKTKGTTDLDAAFAIPFDGPIHPRDPIDDWHERDRMRRGIGPSQASAPSDVA